MDLDTDAINYLNEQMLCSVELANKLVRERKLIPYPIALNIVEQLAEPDSQNVESEFLSAIKRDKIKIAKVSDNTGLCGFGYPVADWKSPSIETLEFGSLSAQDDFNKQKPIEKELSRACYKDIEPPEPDKQTGEPFSRVGRGSSTEQAIYLFDPIDVRDWAKMQYQQSETGNIKKKRIQAVTLKIGLGLYL